MVVVVIIKDITTDIFKAGEVIRLSILWSTDGDAISPAASANDADHSLNDATVSQWKPSSDVTPGSPSHCRGAKYTSTVHPINIDTTQFVYNNYPYR